MPVHLFTYFLQRKDFPPASMLLPPTTALCDVVEGCWWFRARSGGAWCSDGRPCLVVTLNEREQVTDGWCSAQILQGFQQPAPHHSLLIVRFSPSGFYRLAPGKMQQLRHQPRWQFTELFGNDWLTALGPLTGAGHIAARLLSLLEAQAAYAPPVPPLLEEALSVIHRVKGNITIAALTAQLRVNYKWLERKCLAVTGISPKEHARLQRFLHACCYLLESHDLGSTALESGYCDRHHFTREFRRLTGLSPRAYLANT